MKIIVHDTLKIVEPLFTANDSPKALLEKAAPLLFEPDGLQVRLSKYMANKEQNGFYVMQAAQNDGFHLLAMQQVWGLFNPTRNRDLSAWQFEQFAQKNVTQVVEQTLISLCKEIPDALLPPTLNCYLFPTDPANRSLMINNHGLSGFGFTPGHLFLQLWPSDGNLRRLRPLLARLLVHNIRPLPIDTAPTLADWLASEGLASNFSKMACTNQSETPWLDWLSAPTDWPQTLTQIANYYELPSYDDLVVNVYSSMHSIGAERPPPVRALETEEREYAAEIIRAGLNETDPNRIAAYLYGDEIVAEQGHTGIGLQPFAGFEIAYRIVQQNLTRRGQDIFDAINDNGTQITEDLHSPLP